MKYFVYCLIKDGKTVYIGSSTKLLNRIKTHSKDKVFDRVVYCELPNKDIMLDFEAYAISKAQPALNTAFPKHKMQEKPEGLVWKRANLMFLYIDLVDWEYNIGFSALWSYHTKYAVESLGVYGISPHDNHLTYTLMDGKTVALFDGSGLKLSDFMVSLGFLSFDEYEKQSYRSSGLIMVDDYNSSLIQFD